MLLLFGELVAAPGGFAVRLSAYRANDAGRWGGIRRMPSPLVVGYKEILDNLIDHDVVSPTCEAVFASGSVVRGWGNANSDLDLYVVSQHPYEGEFDQLIQGTLKPAQIPRCNTSACGRRVDIEYWLDDQVDQLLERVGEDQLDRTRPAAESLTNREIEFIGRLVRAHPLRGESWLAEKRAAFERSALRAIMVDWCLDLYDNAVEDVVGQLDAGDVDSAVLAASRAFGCAVDALLCHHGDISLSRKWRARRMAAIDSPALSYAEYWQFETMQGFGPSAPEEWIGAVLRACQRIAMEVPVR